MVLLESPRHEAPQGGLYTQIAVLAAGNALSLAVFLMLYHVSAVMSDFRDPMLYAFLCSIALRGPKDWMVEQMSNRLRGRGSLFRLLAIVALPRMAVRWMLRETFQALNSFKEKVEEVRLSYRRKSGSKSCQDEGDGKEAQASSDGQDEPGAAAVEESCCEPHPVILYVKAGFLTLTSRKQRNRRRKHEEAIVEGRHRLPTPASTRLLRWLVVLSFVWIGYEWVRDSWSSTLQVILITFAAMYFSTAMIFPFLGRSLHALGAFSRSSGSPLKTPMTSDVSGGPGSPDKEASRSSLRFLRQRLFVDVHSLSPSTVGQETHAKNAEKGDVSKDDESTSFSNSRVGKFISTIESTFRGLILDNIHSIVTLILIVSLILGTSGTTMFLGFRMAEEARSAVVTARNAFPTAWSKTIYNAPSFLEQDLTDIIVGDFVKDEELGIDNQTSKRALHRLASDMSLPSWLEAHQQNAIDLAQKALPSIASWIENRFDDFLKTHNLTDTIMDIRHLYEAARGPRECSERERMKLMIALSQADVSLRRAKNAEIEVRSTLERLHAAMSTKLDALEKLFFCGDNNDVEQRSSIRQSKSCDNDYSGTEKKLTDPHSGFAYNTSADTAANDSFQEVMNGNDKEIQSLQSAVVELESELAASTSAHQVAVSCVEEAESTHRAALTRLKLCQRPQSQAANDDAGTNDEAGLGILTELSAGLESAYSKIFWHFHFREGFDNLREAFYHAIRRLTAESSAATDLSRLQRVAQTAAVPLIALGRAVAIPLGSSAAAAVMGGFGLLRLGLSVFHLGVQSTLFFTLLYYLLSAKKDPVARAVGVLPLPPNARRHAAEVINTALGGVLISLLKLSAAHGLYTWLTFRALHVPLAYTASVASSAFALLPFVPTYAVALPGSLAVAAQGRLTTSIILLALHFAGYYIGDTILLEDSGGHPFMMSLSILGGLWAFSNPLLGCLLGPILLSLLTAVASLHTELMAGSGGGLGTEQREENDGPTHFPYNYMRPMTGQGVMREKYPDEPPKELRASLRSPEAAVAPHWNRTSLSDASCPQDKCGGSNSIDESVSFEFDRRKSLSEVSSKEVLKENRGYAFKEQEDA